MDGTVAARPRLCVYFPDRDSHERPIDGVQAWVEACADLLTEMNGGATILPVAEGRWQSQKGTKILENTVVVYSYLTDAAKFESRFGEFAELVHKFGKHGRQEAVMVEFSGDGGGKFMHRAYFVDNYVLAD
jgi:hypothetical protein